MPSTDSCLLLIDGGGSGARARLCTFAGEILAEAKGGPANLSSNFVVAQENLYRLANDIYAQAGRALSLKSTDYALVGLAGAGASNQQEELVQGFGFHQMQLVTDIDVTLAAALGTAQDGVVAMLGTGSFFVWRDQKQVRRVGGWGMHLGDECGGAWLGREVLRAAIRAYDGIGPTSDLTADILMQFEGSPKAMVPFARTAQAADFAKFAPALVAAHKSQDPVANEIFDRATQILCDILGPATQLPNQHLCFLGGLGPIYESMMPETYQAICRPAKGAALDGAFWLAQNAFK